MIRYALSTILLLVGIESFSSNKDLSNNNSSFLSGKIFDRSKARGEALAGAKNTFRKSESMIAGKLERKSLGVLFFVPEDKSISYRITNVNDELSQIFNRLDTDDQIYGVATFDHPNFLVKFDSVERIGLHSLLGKWWSDNGVAEFETFTKITVYPNVNENVPDGGCPDVSPRRINFQYSIVPGSGKQWVLFLSTCGNNFYSTIELEDGHGKIQVYGSNGDLLRTFQITRSSIGFPPLL